jgi:hypothetical protein
MNDASESSRRLAVLLRCEQGAMADFLVALADFDRQRLWVQLGHASVFYYLHRGETPSTAPPAPAPAEHRDSTVPLTPNLQRLHMTESRQFLDKLDAARKGQGHAQPGASAEEVIEAALDLLLAQQVKRRAEVKQPRIHPRPSKTGHIPAAVRREVWFRDDAKCQWPVISGGTCGSTLRLEIDHVVPRGRGGPVDGGEQPAGVRLPRSARRPPGLRRRLDGPVHQRCM